MILVPVCIVIAVLLVWLLLEVTRRAFGPLTMAPPSGERIGVADVPGAPRGERPAGHQRAVAPPGGAALAPAPVPSRRGAALTPPVVAVELPALAPTVVMTPVVAPARARVVAPPVVAPAPRVVARAAPVVARAAPVVAPAPAPRVVAPDAEDRRPGMDRLDAKLLSRLRRREPPPVDLGANGARVDVAEIPGDVRVISRARREETNWGFTATVPDPTVEPAPVVETTTRLDPAADPSPPRPGAAADAPALRPPEAVAQMGVEGRDVTVITGARWRDPRVVEARGPGPDSPLAFGADPGAGAYDGLPWVPAGARRAAAIVGSRAREAILGYPFAAADPIHSPAAGAPGGGAEPAPGETVVLEGDDVEAWVRERLYGGRLPER